MNEWCLGTETCSSHTYSEAQPSSRQMQKLTSSSSRAMPRPSCHPTLNPWLSWWVNPPSCSSMAAFRRKSMALWGPSSSLHFSKPKSPKTCSNTSKNRWEDGLPTALSISKKNLRMLVHSLHLTFDAREQKHHSACRRYQTRVINKKEHDVHLLGMFISEFVFLGVSMTFFECNNAVPSSYCPEKL